MIEVKNKTRGPVQLVVRSTTQPKAFSTLNIPGIGSGKNVVLLEDERVIDIFLERIVKTGMVATRYLENKKV